MITDKLLNARILIVDDQEANRQLLAGILGRHGYAVQLAHSGEEALAMVADEQPYLILLDIMMPDLSGYEMCRRLKANKETQNIPVIFISVLQELTDRIKAFELGGVDYIVKPFNTQEILTRVKTHLKLRQQQIELERLHKQEMARNAHLGDLVSERTAQLDRLNHRMATILASVTDAIILAHEDGTIDTTNNSFNQLFGYLPDELFGQPLTRLIQPIYHELIVEAFARASHGETQTDIQVEAVRKDSTTFDIDISFAPVGVDESYIVCNCHDITSLKEMERIKDNFISMVTHELRTPLTGILLISKQLQQYYQRMSEAQFFSKIEQLHIQSKVMAELVESVLDISRLEAQQGRRTTERVYMMSVVQRIIEEMLPLASEKQQSLSLSHDPISGTVEGDSVDLDRIWRNLISNAIKYTPEGGDIQVCLGTIEVQNNAVSLVSPSVRQLPGLSEALSTTGLYCVGQIQDTGLGIAPEDLPHVFERFRRGHAKQLNIPGTGLGLALVKELLAHYKGDIRIDSTLGQGTLVTFWLLLVEEHEHG